MPTKSHEILSRKQSEGKLTYVARVCARKDQRKPELSMSKCQTFKMEILKCTEMRVGIVFFYSSHSENPENWYEPP